MTNQVEQDEKKKYKILLVDDHPIVCQGLAQVIQQEPDLMVCDQAASADEAMICLRSTKPDCIITDLAMEGRSGLELITDVLSVYPDIPMLVLTMYDEMIYAERALHAGALGFIMKRNATDNIIMAIRRILDGEIYVSEPVSARLLRKMVGPGKVADDTPDSRLSKREMEVFKLIGDGQGTRDIAQTLGLSIKTIETYREHIKSKLNLANSRQLMQHAIEWTRVGLER